MLGDHLPRVPLATLPTVIHPLNKLSDLLAGPRIWIKRDDLTAFGGGGNKVRKLEFSLGEARERGADTILTAGGPQSNHVRQTAAAAAHLGLRCIVALSGNPVSIFNGNLLLDRLFGAEIRWVGDQPMPEALEALAGEVSKKRGRPYIIPVGASNEVGSVGYAVAMAELLSQTRASGISFDRIVIPSGSGGTQAGLIVGAQLLGYRGQVLGISVSRTHESLTTLLEGLIPATAGRLGVVPPPPTIDVRADFLGKGYAIVDDAVKEAVSICARSEGLLLDPVYTGKAMAGLISMIRHREIAASETVLFWHTGGSPALYAYVDDLL